MGFGQRGNSARALATQSCVVERGATDFYDDSQFSPSRSSQPNITFMFCTAWPAAPLIRLSRQEIRISRLPSGLSTAPISQKFVRSENWISGRRGDAKIRTHGFLP